MGHSSEGHEFPTLPDFDGDMERTVRFSEVQHNVNLGLGELVLRYVDSDDDRIAAQATLLLVAESLNTPEGLQQFKVAVTKGIKG